MLRNAECSTESRRNSRGQELRSTARCRRGGPRRPRAADTGRGRAGRGGPLADAHFPKGTEICRNQALTSGNGRAVLRVQEDANVVIYDGNNRPVWATDTGD